VAVYDRHLDVSALDVIAGETELGYPALELVVEAVVRLATRGEHDAVHTLKARRLSDPAIVSLSMAQSTHPRLD